MARDGFWLGRRSFGFVPKGFGGATVQRLTAAVEQAVVGRLLDQRVLEAVVRRRRRALNEKDIRMGKPLKRPCSAGSSISATSRNCG
jgi:hypothetical protein